MTDDFDYEQHERLRGRVANEADSVLWTFKAYYEGADWYTRNAIVGWTSVFSESLVC